MSKVLSINNHRNSGIPNLPGLARGRSVLCGSPRGAGNLRYTGMIVLEVPQII